MDIRSKTLVRRGIGGVMLISVMTLLSVSFNAPSRNPEGGSDPPVGSTSGSFSDAHRQDIVFPVEVQVARRGDLVKRVNASGTIRAARELDIVFRIPGVIDTVTVANGSFVRRGDLLARLEQYEFRQAYRHARMALLSAQIEYRTLRSSPVLSRSDSARTAHSLSLVRKVFAGAADSFRAGALQEDRFERIKRDCEAEEAYYTAQREDVIAQKSGLSQATEDCERARMNLVWTEVRAPFDGYVADVERTSGASVSAGSRLLCLVDVSSLHVDVEVLESQAVKIRIGAGAEVRTVASPMEPLRGHVQNVNPVVDRKSRTLRLTVALEGSVHGGRVMEFSPGALCPGMIADVSIQTDVLHNRLLVPKDAPVVRDSRQVVFTVVGGLAQWHYVETGEEDETFVEIRSGITEGDTVISAGHYALVHDAVVTVAHNGAPGKHLRRGDGDPR
jgi:RND family efflux transporter MFP subunit